MKKLFLFLLISLPFSVMAQKAEVGINAGFSSNTSPSGNIYYVADKPMQNLALSATFVGNIPNTHFQVGADIYAIGLANKASKALAEPYFGRIIGGNNETFTYAKLAISVCPVFNYKYNLSDNGYVYAGLALGIVGSLADPQKPSNSDGSEVTFRGINGGFGFTGGGQAGITYAITSRIALNAEIALRYYYLSFTTSDSYPGGSSNIHLGTLAYPITFGIRYRMGFEKQLNYATGRYEIAKERKFKNHTEK
jgi:hypothetical protein